MSEKRVIDWEGIEGDYRAGLLSLREIGAKRGISPAMILKRANKDGWERDLTAKIQAKAEAAVNKSLVNAEVNGKRAVSEREIIDVNVAAVTNVRITHRSNFKRASDLSIKLMRELEEADPDDYPLNQRISCMKSLADTLKTLTALEREAWGLATIVDTPPPVAIDPLEGARRLAFALNRASSLLPQE